MNSRCALGPVDVSHREKKVRICNKSSFISCKQAVAHCLIPIYLGMVDIVAFDGFNPVCGRSCQGESPMREKTGEFSWCVSGSGANERDRGQSTTDHDSDSKAGETQATRRASTSSNAPHKRGSCQHELVKNGTSSSMDDDWSPRSLSPVRRAIGKPTTRKASSPCSVCPPEDAGELLGGFCHPSVLPMERGASCCLGSARGQVGETSVRRQQRAHRGVTQPPSLHFPPLQRQ